MAALGSLAICRLTVDGGTAHLEWEGMALARPVASRLVSASLVRDLVCGDQRCGWCIIGFSSSAILVSCIAHRSHRNSLITVACN